MNSESKLLRAYIYRFAPGKIRLWLLSLFLFLVNAVPAQAFSESEYHHIRDSLLTLAQHSIGTEKVDVIFLLIRHIGPWETDTCKILLLEELELAEKLEYNTGIAKAYQNSGDLHFYRNDFVLAFSDYLSALRIFDPEKDFKEIGDTYFRLSMVFYSTADFQKSGQYRDVAIECYDKGNCVEDLFIVHLETGYYFNNFTKDFETAKHYHRKALKYVEQSSLSPFFYAATYISYELSFSLLNQYDSAIYCLNQAKKFSTGRSKDEKLLNSIIFRRLGRVYSLKGDYDSASYYSQKSIIEADKISFLYIKTAAWSDQGRNAMILENWQKALEFYESALENSLKVYTTSSFYSDIVAPYTNDWIMDVLPGNFKVFSSETRKLWALRYIIRIYKQIADIHSRMGDLQSAMKSMESYHAWEDTLSQKTKTLQLVGLQLGYETVLKDQEIENLKQEAELKEYKFKQSRDLMVGAAGILLLGGMIILLLFRQNKLKAEQDRVILQQKLLRSQMNPHFMFNSLTNIQHMILSEDAEQASIYLSDFSTLVRSVLHSTVTDRISYEQEIEIIRSYLKLQKLRYENFDFNIEVDPLIDVENLAIPPMLAQPFIENSIEHGFRNKGGRGHLQVNFILKGGSVHLEIIDDGIGRQKSAEIKEKTGKTSQSLSTGITIDRIKVLNRGKSDKFRLQIIDRKNVMGAAEGTKVIIEIPVESSETA